MGGERRYVLGVDGLPLGVAAAAVGGEMVTSTYLVVDDRGRPLPLAERVARAIEVASDDRGRPAGEVRLVCIDDREAGQVVEAVAAEVAGRGIDLVVVGVMVGDGESDLGPDQQRGPSDHRARSLQRALAAASD